MALARVMPVSNRELEKICIVLNKFVSFIGFHSLHLGLGVRCLPLHTLLHYIDNGVLQLTETCVRKLLKGTVNIVFHLLPAANWECCPWSRSPRTQVLLPRTLSSCQSVVSVRAVADGVAYLKGESQGSGYVIGLTIAHKEISLWREFEFVVFHLRVHRKANTKDHHRICQGISVTL